MIGRGQPKQAFVNSLKMAITEKKALAVADQLLYRAKHEGRNRVVTPVHSVHLP